MQIEINKAKVKAMVSLLRKQIVPGMPSSKAYETVSHLLGYPNWDTLSGLISKGKQKFSERSGLSDKQMRWTQRHGWRAQAPVVREPFTVFVQANNTNEWADGPGWVKWVVDQEFVDLLQKVHTQCLENDNSHIAVDWLPEQWGNDETLRLQGDTLNVSCSFFLLVGAPQIWAGASGVSGHFVQGLLCGSGWRGAATFHGVGRRCLVRRRQQSEGVGP